MGVGLAMLARNPRATNTCHSATSLPTPSPSAFTWVVSATRRPGASTAATSRAARARSGGIETPLAVMASRYKKGHGKTSRKGVARTASRDDVSAARWSPRPDERQGVRARPGHCQAPAYGERVLLEHEPARHFHRNGKAGDLHHAGHVDRVREGVRVRAQNAFGRLALIDDDGDKGVHTRRMAQSDMARDVRRTVGGEGVQTVRD